MGRLDWATTVADADEAFERLAALDEVRGTPGVVGFCFGGGLAFNVAADVAPAVLVSYYGSALPGLLDLAPQVTCPSLHHFGTADDYLPLAQVDAITAAVTADGRPARVELHEGANHAFDNDDFFLHHPEATARAWQQTTAFLCRAPPRLSRATDPAGGPSYPHDLGNLVRLAAGATVLALATGCGGDEPTTATEAPPPSGPVCPDELADEGSGDPADAAPGLRLPERASVCRYELSDAAWRLVGEPVEVSGGRWAAVADGLGALAPADPGRMCTQELGPRWLVVWDDGTGRTGAVLEGYGCRDVHLTDGSGALSGPAGLEEAIRAAYDG